MEPEDLVEQYERNLPTRELDVVCPGISGEELDEVKQLSEEEYDEMACYHTVPSDVELKVNTMVAQIREKKMKKLSEAWDELDYNRKLAKRRQVEKSKKDIDNKTVTKPRKVTPWRIHYESN